jgi:hypothetical protein
MRTRKLKDEKGNVLKNPDNTEQTEEYESKRRFIDPSKISLSQKGYAIDEGRPFYVSMSLFDTPARSLRMRARVATKTRVTKQTTNRRVKQTSVKCSNGMFISNAFCPFPLQNRGEGKVRCNKQFVSKMETRNGKFNS